MSTSGKRGKYTPRACNHCRRRKKRCDGGHPVCGPCLATGHDCQWGPDNARKANTKRYVDSLRTMNQLLEQRVRELEAQVTGPSSLSDGLFLTSYPPPSEDVSPMGSHCSSPRSDETLVKREDSEDPEVAQLAAPSYHLHLEDENLHMYGPTSILRLAPRDSPPPMHDMYDMDSSIYILGVQLEVAWDRYLPSGVLLTQNEHDRLLDVLFRYYTSWCLRVMPELFLRDMHRVLSTPIAQAASRTTHYSPMLHNALLAVATAFSDNPAVKDPISRKRFAEQAKEYLELECERPRLSTVVALSMLASYHSSEGSSTLGYVYFGISARMAQALGLSLDSQPWANMGYISRSNMRDRNWTFWVTFCQDTTWSLYMGRDFCINSSSKSEKVPAPFTEDDPEPAPWNWPPGQSDYGSNILRTFPATCELLSIGREIMEVVSNFSRLGIRQDANDFVIGQMDLKLNTWKNNLSVEVDVTKSNMPAASPHQLMLQMTYHWLVIVLHRPFYRRYLAKDEPSFEINHVKICNKAAMDIMEFAGVWRSQWTLRYVPFTFIQTIATAGTVFVLAALHAASGARLAQRRLEEACSMAECTIDHLREIAVSFTCARTIADILRGLLDNQVRDRLARRAAEARGPAPPAQVLTLPKTASPEAHVLTFPADFGGHGAHGQSVFQTISMYDSPSPMQMRHALPQPPMVTNDAFVSYGLPYTPSAATAPAQVSSISDHMLGGGDEQSFGYITSSSSSSSPGSVYGFQDGTLSAATTYGGLSFPGVGLGGGQGQSQQQQPHSPSSQQQQQLEQQGFGSYQQGCALRHRRM